MIDVKIKLPDGRIGLAEINPDYSLKDLKNQICEDVNIKNPELYYIVITPYSESDLFKNILKNKITIEFKRKLEWVIEPKKEEI